jgi:hypothetical protein
MSRRAIALAVLSLAAIVVVAACQDYNFNPVGACILQPGSTQAKLENVTVADVLFVVDDSGSMDSKQQALAQHFSGFIQALANKQKDLASRGLEPFEFHIAVTTSSLFAYDSSFHTTYPSSFVGCTQGTAVANGPYPDGNFVSAPGNDMVLHFTKTLDWSSWGTSSVDPNLNNLVKEFVGTCSTGGLCSPSCTGTCSGGNVEVGSCGSGQEQHLEAARLAINKALAGQQPIQPGEWPHPNAKMVVVFVADEDDCSNPADYTAKTAAIQMTDYTPGNDSCVADKNANPPDGVKEYPISGASGYTAFFSGLGRPFGAAFIVAANECTQLSTVGTCAPADSTYVQSPASCTGTAQYACAVAYAAGVRHLALASALHADGFDVVEGSVCEDFGPILAGTPSRPGIADLVSSPPKLTLSSQPASSDITVLRIIDSSGNQREICQEAQTQADAATAGWWFMDCSLPTSPAPPVATGTTQCIYINHDSMTCEANPGETYSAEYLGMIPPGGCPGASNESTPGYCAADATCSQSSQMGQACGTGGVCHALNQCCTPPPSAACAQALSGSAQNWSCYGPTGGTGTCICTPGR